MTEEISAISEVAKTEIEKKKWTADRPLESERDELFVLTMMEMPAGEPLANVYREVVGWDGVSEREARMEARKIMDKMEVKDRLEWLRQGRAMETVAHVSERKELLTKIMRAGIKIVDDLRKPLNTMSEADVNAQMMLVDKGIMMVTPKDTIASIRELNEMEAVYHAAEKAHGGGNGVILNIVAPWEVGKGVASVQEPKTIDVIDDVKNGTD